MCVSVFLPTPANPSDIERRSARLAYHIAHTPTHIDPLPGLSDPAGKVYPCLHEIRSISVTIAAEVIKAAAEEGRARGKAVEKLANSEAALIKWIKVGGRGVRAV
jgi:hypothetical protein